ncbi:hypothetical protein ABE82_26920 (plasmid) [Paenibacillus peoriae]|uniref:hypothetical protein n=1 Tax=Paenibacillus peoriae TaxID=59893 RepID=UPI000720C512|nr:hypothetical protein [Paenibacillus peoriae]ALS10039.1 hypothetical protein ABE82_26920 [Paenibacillus peoriae]
MESKYRKPDSFICIGQHGERLGDDLSRLGNSVFAINTSNSDLADLKQITDGRIELESLGAMKDHDDKIKEITRSLGQITWS